MISACDCDPTGSLYDGECENRNDEGLDLVAGRCICKTYVTGRRCDTCQEGYWNLQEDSADGCEGMKLFSSEMVLKTGSSNSEEDFYRLIIPPAKRSFRGVYCFQPVRHSVIPSFRDSVIPSFRQHLDIFAE